MLLQDWYSTLPKECTIIELTEDIEAGLGSAGGRQRGCAQQGYRIALDDFRPGPQMDSLIELAHLIKVEMHTPKAQQEVMLREFHARGIRMLSEKVETDADYPLGSSRGIRLFSRQLLRASRGACRASKSRPSNCTVCS